MSEPQSLRDAFSRAESVVADVERYVRETLSPYCDDRGYLFLGRRKTLSSLAEKLEGGRVDRWSKLDDLYACTVVIPVASHEKGVLRKLDSAFTRVSVRSRDEAQKAPDVFRFDGLRWYGHVGAIAAAQRQVGVGSQLFECQILTAFEYAWITVTHDLVYKGDDVDWRRQRLAAQLKAAVEQIELLIGTFDSASSAVKVSPWPESEVRQQILSRTQLLVQDGLVPETLVPGSWRRFTDNVYALVRSYCKSTFVVAGEVAKLLDTIDEDLRGASPLSLPYSGTLFQYFVSAVGRETTPGHLRDFVVVPSQELADMYKLANVPKAFDFDGSSLVVATSEVGHAGTDGPPTAV